MLVAYNITIIDILTLPKQNTNVNNKNKNLLFFNFVLFDALYSNFINSIFYF